MSTNAALAAPIRPQPSALYELLRDGFRWLGANSTGAHRMREIRRLETMSDADLAARGLSRDRIVAHIIDGRRPL
jgi:hypothetical protein